MEPNNEVQPEFEQKEIENIEEHHEEEHQEVKIMEEPKHDISLNHQPGKH